MFSKENSNYLLIAENDKEHIGFIIGLFEKELDGPSYPKIIDEELSKIQDILIHSIDDDHLEVPKMFIEKYQSYKTNHFVLLNCDSSWSRYFIHSYSFIGNFEIRILESNGYSSANDYIKYRNMSFLERIDFDMTLFSI